VTRHVPLAGAARPASVLVEREGDLAALDECLQAVRRGPQGRIVLVSGESGVGKTALLRRFAEECDRPVRVLWGGCDPLFTPRPLGPLLGVAESVSGELEDAIEGRALPHEVVAALARELQGRVPTVFVLEDLHWADEATLDVFRLLARRIERVPALIVATYRDDELAPAHPLRIVVGELGTGPAIKRLKLAALSLAAVAQLAEPYGIDARELYRKTAGNPFFVIEVLAAGVYEMPDTVTDAISARTARLDPSARQLLKAVSIVLPQAELWLLEELAREAIDGLDECLTSGMLTSVPQGIAFRHELVRVAIEESTAPNQRIELHRRALAALTDPPGGERDLARLAYHAEAAGDVDAVVRFAPAAASGAASLGAHREAAAQYARALRFGDGLAAAARAELLEDLARECYLTDQYSEGIAALEQALEIRRSLGDNLREGDALRRLSEFFWCPGRTAESERCARDAVALLEGLPPSRELASAYANLALTCLSTTLLPEADAWCRRALDLADRLGETEIAIYALSMIAACSDYDLLERSLERARSAGLSELVAFIYLLLGIIAVEIRDCSTARRHLEAGIEYCSDRGLELFRLYLLAYRARLELDTGRWSEATDSAESVLRIPRTSNKPRVLALVVLALVRARRGDPGVWPLLDEAWALAEPTGELPRLGPVAAARAEVAWLEGNPNAIGQATDDAFRLACEREATRFVGELAGWRRRAGIDTEIAIEVATPYALELAADPARAAEAWREIGCPYEAALALADADEEESLRRAHAELQALNAAPAAAIIARRLRQLGARGVPRGPRARTRDNPAGLTARELDVLALLADGLRNAQIAERLVVSAKTVDHHVSAILRKLSVHTRGEATAAAARLGLTGPALGRDER
jgi:DNA-binding CsgD family transcriptional regulator/tetratricopeptide (TPR) repeat protein